MRWYCVGRSNYEIWKVVEADQSINNVMLWKSPTLSGGHCELRDHHLPLEASHIFTMIATTNSTTGILSENCTISSHNVNLFNSSSVWTYKWGASSGWSQRQLQNYKMRAHKRENLLGDLCHAITNHPLPWTSFGMEKYLLLAAILSWVTKFRSLLCRKRYSISTLAQSPLSENKHFVHLYGHKLSGTWDCDRTCVAHWVDTLRQWDVKSCDVYIAPGLAPVKWE